MSIASEITRLTNAKSAIAAAIANKGVAVPSATLLDGMAALIGQISGGGGGSITLPSGWGYDYGTITPASDIAKSTDITLTKGNQQPGSINANYYIAMVFSPEIKSDNKNAFVSGIDIMGLVYKSGEYKQAFWTTFINSNGGYNTENAQLIQYYNSASAMSRIQVKATSNRKLIAGMTYYGVVFGRERV